MRIFALVMVMVLGPMLGIAQDKQEMQTVNFKDLLQKEGKYFQFGKTEPYTGQCIEYHTNEMPKNVAYMIDGKLEGRFVTYDPFGNKEGEARYVAGRREGLETHWHTNGKKKSEATFKNGVMTGTYTEYDEAEQPTRSARYEAGEIVSKTRYEAGKAVDTRTRQRK